MTARRTSYPPGFFTELVRLHNWPPGFVSQISVPVWSDTDRREAAVRGRETAMAAGHTGAIAGISRKADEQIQASKAKFNRRQGR